VPRSTIAKKVKLAMGARICEDCVKISEAAVDVWRVYCAFSSRSRAPVTSDFTYGIQSKALINRIILMASLVI
jgi:hypothetical protein